MSGQPQAAGYPGNLSLPAEVREKILSTFRHTLDLYREGKFDDCLIGCDFILKMDPRFAPARKLLEKTKNPKADVDIAELQGIVSPAPAAPAPAAATREAGTAAAPRRDTADVRPESPKPSGTDGGGKRDTEPHPVEGLEDLSLDSLSLDGPLPDLNFGVPDAPFAGLSQGPLAGDPGLSAPHTMSSEDQIALLLRKGDDASASGQKQQAIEIWSRIFLIDINHPEAARRIEAVREEMAEDGRRVAASLGHGEDSFAKAGSGLAPGDLLASLASASPDAAPSPHDLSAVATPGDVLAEELEGSGPRRSWSSIPRPPRGTEADEEKPETAAKLPAFLLNRRTLVFAGAVLAAILVSVFLVLRPPAAATRNTQAESAPSLEHATQLFREGKIAETGEELRRIPPEDPDYARAQKLLASLVAREQEAAHPAPGNAPAAAAPPASADPGGLRAQAERALAEKRYIDAMKSFSLAAPHFQGDPAFVKEMAAAAEKVSELTPAVKLYNDGEFETAIPILWRIYQASRDNQDARSYLIRSYYNQGITQLQNGQFDKAKESFNEVLSLDPQDTDAARHRKFAERYFSGDLDLMGRIYLRYVSPRP